MYAIQNINVLILVILVLVIILVYYVWVFIENRDGRWSGDKFIDLLSAAVPVQTVRRDCDAETVYSMADSQCLAVCRGPETYFSRNGACVNTKLKQTTGSSRPIRHSCDPKRGVLAYLVGNSQFGSTDFECLSVDPGVQPDNVSLPNTILVNGTVPIDYLKKFPNFQDGSCLNSDNDAIITIPSTLTVRATGYCVNKNLQILFET